MKIEFDAGGKIVFSVSTMKKQLPEFKNGMDIRCRDFKKPTVARFWVTETKMRFAVVGTDYGYLHTNFNNVKTWGSYSGARRAAKSYVSF